jgi:hypothetical protein
LLMDFKLKSQNVYAMELKLVKLHKWWSQKITNIGSR